MSVKEYTRVIKNEVTVFRRTGFHPIKEMKEMLQFDSNACYRIEYVFIDQTRLNIAAMYLFHGLKKVGAVFPYGCFQNNMKLS